MQIFLTLVALTLASVIVARSRMARMFRLYRGMRVVTCPETRAPAAVRVRALRGALTLPFGIGPLRLRSCSRWPARRACGQSCLEQVTAAPKETRVDTILAHWYEGRTCAYCGRPFAQASPPTHRPGALSPAGRTVLWHDVAPEEIPAALNTHLPVCWDCHIAETFRRKHPELVVDDPWTERTGRHR